ncbi:MAG: SWIM zinc finger family protein [Candidatus Obscuribacterales bacterium]|nr:SWIM zinc finger family protein [Candidatus Obscuribacterales bacterium]
MHRWLFGRMSAYSEAQVLALAPDQGSARSGRELANRLKWLRVGADSRCVWGECQGSGKLPYQTAVDLGQLAFKCSCPSRKFPCKHGLALMLLFVREGESFAAEIPEWVAQWLRSRQERAERKFLKADESELAVATIPDLQAKVRRQAERQARVESGISEFRLWLYDRIRHGLARLESEPYQVFENAAARLTDAQAPGLARILRQCAGIPNSGEGWQERLLDKLSLLHLATEGFLQSAFLPEDLQQDLRSIVGFTVSQDELLKEATAVRDNWQVMGQRLEIEERLKTQRTWLRGEESGRWALILSFAHGVQPLDQSFSTGSTQDAELVFFPGRMQQRALLKEKFGQAQPLNSFRAYESADAFADDYAQYLASNPWVESFPAALANLKAGFSEGGTMIVYDRENSILPLASVSGVDWQILALSGGFEFSLFGEWNGERLLPLSIVSDSGYARLDQRSLVSVA